MFTELKHFIVPKKVFYVHRKKKDDDLALVMIKENYIRTHFIVFWLDRCFHGQREGRGLNNFCTQYNTSLITGFSV